MNQRKNKKYKNIYVNKPVWAGLVITDENGITIIALIITIIVLLILVGVSINLIVGDNGIFVSARQVAEEAKIATAEEKIKLAIGEYEVKQRLETLYSLLEKIKGLESITPDDANQIPPCHVIVDRYEFEVTGNLEVKYIQKMGGISPEIEKFEKSDATESKVTLKINASTKDSQGLKKIIIKNGDAIIEQKDIAGNQIEENIDVTSNGKYTITIIGKNGRRITSEIIDVTEINTINGKITAGTVINGKVALVTVGESGASNISKVEVYSKGKKVSSKEFTDKNIEYETEVKNLIFYEDTTCYAIITDSYGKTFKTNEVVVKNTDSIGTSTDLSKLSTMVNEGEDFEGKKIKQVAAITSNSHTAIGTIEHPFKGIYDGQGETVDITVNNANDCQGLFGYIEGATIKNIILDGGGVVGATKVGGAVGYAKCSTIDNVINKDLKNGSTHYIRVSNKSTYSESGVYVPRSSYGTSSETWTQSTVASVGGICGKAEDTIINNCHMQGFISGSGMFIGGIVGYAKGSNMKITDCTNSGIINDSIGSGYVGGIVGVTQGSVLVQNCTNNDVEVMTIDSSGSYIGGIVGYNIGGTINKCTNNGSINGKTEVGGIVGANSSESESRYVELSECDNSGVIQSSGTKVMQCQNNGSSLDYPGTCLGGIAGFAVKTNITSCSNNKTVKSSSSGYSIGGIVGELRDGEITRCDNGKNGDIGNGKEGCVGGIVGFGIWQFNINNCYNLGSINGKNWIGGICGVMRHANLRYCYNGGAISGISTVGGIVGSISPFSKESYDNNYIYYSYNRGLVSGDSYVGSINGNLNYGDVDYIYSLTGASTKILGGVFEYKNATHKDAYDKATLTSTVLSNFEGNFKSDYTGKASVNEGFPILSWQ